MNFGIGVVAGAIGMIVFLLLLLVAFIAREFIRGFRKGLKRNETTEEINT